MNPLDLYSSTLLIFLPVLGSIVTLLLPTALTNLLGMTFSALAFLVSLYIWGNFDSATVGLQFFEKYSWIEPLGINYIVGIDGLNILLILLTTFLTPLVLIHQWGEKGVKHRSLVSLILLLEAGMLGSLVAFDLILFYVFWEAMLIPMYFIIGVWGGSRRIYASTKFVLYTVLGSLLMLAAGIILYISHFDQFGFYSTNLLELYKVNTSIISGQNWLFLAFALAFAIKVPLWPFHTWLPDAHVEAPTIGSVILAGVLLKLGTYGMLRFAVPLFPGPLETYASLIMALGVIGIIYGALTAWVQKDAKKLVAYSSVSHLGFVVLGCVGITGLKMSEEALTGAVYQMINHGLSTGALFFLVGVIYERRHTRMLDDFGGLASVMPWFATMLIVATMGSVGLPGTGGFVGEFLILLGTFKVSPFYAVLACTGVLLGAIYMLSLCKDILFGPIKHEANKSLKDLTGREFLYIAPLAILIVLTGVLPNLFLDKVRPSIKHLSDNYQEYRLEAPLADLDTGKNQGQVASRN